MRNKTPDKIALERAIKRLQMMQEWTTWQGRTWIGISFTHMMVTMALFQTSSTGIVLLIQKVVMGITVLLLDLGIMHYSHIIYKTKEAGLESPFRLWMTYQMMVWAEWIFNFSSLYSNRPAAAKMPGILSAGLSFLFGSIVTLSILNTPLIIDLLGRLATDHMSALAKIHQEEEEEIERKQREWEAEQERKAERERINQERRERRQASTVPPSHRLAPPSEDAVYTSKAGNVDDSLVILVDGKTKKIDARSADWLTMNTDQEMSYQDISDSLGGKPSKAYIGLSVKLYRESLVRRD